MKLTIRWLSLAALLLLPLYHSATYADAITLLPGSSHTFTFSIPGNASLNSRVVFSLNAGGTMLSLNAINLAPIGSGIDIIDVRYTALNPVTFFQVGLTTSGGFQNPGFLTPGQSGGAVVLLSRPVLEGFINPTFRVVFRLSNGQTVTAMGTLAEVPEPATLLLLSTGLIGVAAKARRRKKPQLAG